MSPLRLALICLCLAPLASSAALSGQVHFSGRVINPACLIVPQRNRIDVSCQHRSPEQVALTDNPLAMPCRMIAVRSVSTGEMHSTVKRMSLFAIAKVRKTR